jgi:hypothetical protein
MGPNICTSTRATLKYSPQVYLISYMIGSTRWTPTWATSLNHPGNDQGNSFGQRRCEVSTYYMHLELICLSTLLWRLWIAILNYETSIYWLLFSASRQRLCLHVWRSWFVRAFSKPLWKLWADYHHAKTHPFWQHKIAKTHPFWQYKVGLNFGEEETHSSFRFINDNQIVHIMELIGSTRKNRG